MWKHACAFTKWVPSNQFMYANLDYNPQTMTLERFGFIGMDRKCYWGSIGVLWKRPLPVEQILPTNTVKLPKNEEEKPPVVNTGDKIQTISTINGQKMCFGSAATIPEAGDDVLFVECSKGSHWVKPPKDELLQLKDSDLCIDIVGINK